MSGALSSQRALYALRMVMRDYKIPPRPRRPFSVAVLPNYPSSSRPSPLPSSSSGDTWNLRHAASDVPTSDFLESPSSSEYDSAGLTLPPRLMSTEHWATLYPTPTSTIFHPHAPSRRCDTLAHLASTGELGVARTVYNELTALHIGIQRRAIYLSAALAALSQTEAGKADFLFWLELVPNRPAVRSHPGVKAVWEPVVDRIINDFPTDRTFISDFLFLAARKGILPTVLPRLMRHVALFTPLSELKGMMEELQRLYLAGTTSRRSTSARAAAHAAYAQMRTEGMRNAFVRVLASAGWVQEAEDMMAVGEWADETREYVQARSEGMVVKLPVEPEETTLVDRIWAARNTQISTKNLAELIDQLEARQRSDLVERLERRLLGTLDPSRRETWYHAQIHLARQRGASNEAIVQLFDRNFSWVGIPPVNLTSSSSPSSSPKLVPSSALFTSLLPSILPLVASPLEYHKSYLAIASTLSPRLRPTAGTHAAFVRHITHLLGPSAGLDALRNMLDADFEPGLGIYEAILWSMAGRAEWDGVQRLLGGMEARVEIGKGWRMPAPEEGTYKGIVGILRRTGMEMQAEQIRRGAVMRF